MASLQTYDEMANLIRTPQPDQVSTGLDALDLVRQATLAASSHNTQPWKFSIRPHEITVAPDFSRRCPVVDPDDSHLFKSLGCAAENLVHAAAAQGYAAQVRFDPDAHHVVVALHPDAALGPTALSRAIPLRQCTKTAYDGTPVEAHELALLEAAGQGHDVRTILLSSEAEKDVVIDHVTRGDLAQLTDAAFRDELVSWIRFDAREAIRTRDGLSGRTTGQPGLPRRIARWLLRFVLSPRKRATTDARHIRSSAGVAVFVSRGNDEAAWVEVGRAYERVALQATALGIRTAFINQPIEVPALRPSFESWLGLEGEHAQLVVRFGRAAPAPFSLRRPVDDVMMSTARAPDTEAASPKIALVPIVE